MESKILVSIQNVKEIIQILKNPPDIVDLKNPLEGSLGAVPVPVIQMVGKHIDTFNLQSSRKIAFSVAIGDFPQLPGTASIAAYGVAHLHPDYVKIGLFGPRNLEEGVVLTKSVVEAVHLISQNIKVVVVGYADQKELHSSINPMFIPEIALLGGADIAMLDTKLKNGQSLFDHLSLKDIQQFVKDSRDKKLSVALAGALNFNHIDMLKRIHPDIVGVRSMVCGNFDRVNGELKPDLLTRLKIAFE